MSWLFHQPLIVFIVEFHNERQIICRGIGFRYKNIKKKKTASSLLRFPVDEIK
jgi:hypothetical protein